MKFTILIIDDEKNIREGLAADFEMDGYNVKIAANGKEGLDLLSKGDIFLVSRFCVKSQRRCPESL